MPRLVGLAYASRCTASSRAAGADAAFSRNGDEIAFGTIGNASCAEGMFWESVNAIGVLKAPMLLSIWDDGYGISVPNEFQITKANLSRAAARASSASPARAGYDISTGRGLGLPRALRDLHEAPPRSCAASTCRRSSTSPR
jgi:hypothetical protein